MKPSVPEIMNSKEEPKPKDCVIQLQKLIDVKVKTDPVTQNVIITIKLLCHKAKFQNGFSEKNTKMENSR